MRPMVFEFLPGPLPPLQCLGPPPRGSGFLTVKVGLCALPMSSSFCWAGLGYWEL